LTTLDNTTQHNRQVKMLAGTLPSPKQGQGELGGFLKELGYEPSQVFKF
jgi:hypothetical protein